MELIKYQPEKLSLWDRWFNRHKKIPIEIGDEIWCKHPHEYVRSLDYKYSRDYVIYHIVDRLTGSYRIQKEYLN